MANIRSITVDVTTGSGQDDTDGDVYLGIAGREFYLDNTDDNFKAGKRERFVFGVNADVLQPAVNDPRSPQLTLGQAESNDVYIRFTPTSRQDAWPLARVEVFVNDGTARGRSLVWRNQIFEPQVVLSIHSTQVLHLGKYVTTSLSAAGDEGAVLNGD